MPLYMDIHDFQGATAEQIAKAHAADLEMQGKYQRPVSQVLAQ